MGLPNTSLQAIELNPSFQGQTHSNLPGTSPGYENTMPGCIPAVLHIPFTNYPLKSSNAKFGKVV